MDNGDLFQCISVCRDVIDVMTLHARMMSRDSASPADVATVCAELFAACVEECPLFDHDHCQTCAEIVEECAHSCREMIGE